MGPFAFSGLICYRLVANTAIVYLTAPSFDKLDKAMTTEHALLIYGIAFGVAVVSLAATLCSMEPGYRHTFFGSKTGKQFWVSDSIEQRLQPSHITSSTPTVQRPYIPHHTHPTTLQPPHSARVLDDRRAARLVPDP